MVSPRATTSALLLVGILAAAGCGGSDPAPKAASKPSEQPEAQQPRPREPITAQVAPFARAIAQESCPAFQRLRFSLVRGHPPGAPAAADECRGPESTLRFLRGGRLDRAGQFGTAAAMEGPNARGGRTFTLWVLDGDRRFRYVGVTGVAPQLGTPFARRKEAARLAARLIQGVQAKDCRIIEPLLGSRGSRLAYGKSKRAACHVLLDGKFFAPAVHKSAVIHQRVLGGTRSLAFVGISTRTTYFTLLLGKFGTPTLLVLDVLPSTPVKPPKS